MRSRWTARTRGSSVASRRAMTHVRVGAGVVGDGDPPRPRQVAGEVAVQRADAGLEHVGLVVDRHHDLHDRVGPVVDRCRRARRRRAAARDRDRRRRAAGPTRSWSPRLDTNLLRPLGASSEFAVSRPAERARRQAHGDDGATEGRAVRGALDRTVVGVDQGGHDGQARARCPRCRSAGRRGPGRPGGSGRRPTPARCSGKPGPSSATSIRAPSAPGPPP